MNEKDQELEGLNLEEIMKEFSDLDIPAPAEEPVHEIPAPVLTEEPEEPAQEPAEEPAEPEVPGEPETEPAEPEDAPVEESPAQEPEEAPEQVAEPAAEPEQTEAPAVEAEETPEEPAPEGPEPAFAEEDFSFFPSQPIPFRPRSRLRELKRQLIAGPEKRYYELSEIGVGKLQAAIIVCLLVVLISAGVGFMYASDMIPENRTRLMVFGQIFAMLLGALMGYNQLMDGIGDLFHGKFTLNTMLFFTFIACCIDGFFCLRELRVPICAAFTLEVMMALWATYHRRSTEMGEMDTMRKATRLDSMLKVDDYYEGKPGFVRGEGQVEDFMDRYLETPAPERKQNIYAFLCLLLSITIAVVAGLFHGLSMAFQICSTTLLVSVPASFFVSTTRPLAVLERRLHSLGTVLCGWNGVRELSARAVFPLTDSDIFPAGSVKLNGVKFYGDRDPETTVAYASALIRANGGSLEPMFTQLLESRRGPKYPVKNFRMYPGGIGGEVCDEPVIVGTLKFLQDMGVEVPAGTMVNQAVYVSIDGEFSGLFALNYARMKYSASGLATICSYRRLTPVIVADDFMLSPGFLKEKFGIKTRRMVDPDREEKLTLANKLPAEDAPALALTTQDGLAPAAYAVTGARAIRTACALGLTIHMVGGVLGLLIMAALAILGEVALLTPLNILLYQLIWMIPGLLVTEWTRAI